MPAGSARTAAGAAPWSRRGKQWPRKRSSPLDASGTRPSAAPPHSPQSARRGAGSSGLAGAARGRRAVLVLSPGSSSVARGRPGRASRRRRGRDRGRARSAGRPQAGHSGPCSRSRTCRRAGRRAAPRRPRPGRPRGLVAGLLRRRPGPGASPPASLRPGFTSAAHVRRLGQRFVYRRRPGASRLRGIGRSNTPGCMNTEALRPSWGSRAIGTIPPSAVTIAGYRHGRRPRSTGCAAIPSPAAGGACPSPAAVAVLGGRSCSMTFRAWARLPHPARQQLLAPAPPADRPLPSPRRPSLRGAPRVGTDARSAHLHPLPSTTRSLAVGPLRSHLPAQRSAPPAGASSASLTRASKAARPGRHAGRLVVARTRTTTTARWRQAVGPLLGRHLSHFETRRRLIPPSNMPFIRTVADAVAVFPSAKNGAAEYAIGTTRSTPAPTTWRRARS